MYGIIGAIRNKEFGTATRIDDLWLYGPGNELQITSQEKVNIITNFNKTYYKPYVLESEDMELNYVKYGTINEETRTVQEILKDSGYVVTVTGKCDSVTVTAIKEFQTDFGLKVDGWVGKLTWDKLLYETSTGTTRFCQFITRTAKYI
jgi:peptidoglycan hydrolase-like protein with peptidoglycan-binding domain